MAIHLWPEPLFTPLPRNDTVMTTPHRHLAFGQTKRSALDLVIQNWRTHTISSHVPNQSIVVDLGCGWNGETLINLKDRVAKGVGIDLAVNPKGNDNPHIKLLAGRVDQSLKLPDQSATVVLATAIIEHVDHPDVFVNEAYRILKPGGKLLITTPSNYARPILELMAFRLHLISQEEIADHKRYYSIKTLHQELIGAGFSSTNITVRPFELGLNLLAIATK